MYRGAKVTCGCALGCSNYEVLMPCCLGEPANVTAPRLVVVGLGGGQVL